MLKAWKSSPRVGVGDVLVFVGVQPDLVFAALHDSGGEPLLKKESRHGCLKEAIVKVVIFEYFRQ